MAQGNANTYRATESAWCKNKDEKVVCRNGCGGSYLAFDVYFAKCGGTKALEECGSVSNFHTELHAIVFVGFLLDDILCTMGFDKFTTRIIVVEAEFVSEESQCYVSISTLS